MQSVRQTKRLPEEIRHLQDMFQDVGAQGPDSWRNEIKLVEVLKDDDRSDC